MAALAEFERALISGRSKTGMQAARKRVKHLGRPASGIFRGGWIFQF